MCACEADGSACLFSDVAVAGGGGGAGEDYCLRGLKLLYRRLRQGAEVSGGGIYTQEILRYEELLERRNIGSTRSARERARERGAEAGRCGDSGESEDGRR